MDIEKIRELRNADPFKPFNLILKDGRKLPVDQSYYLGISPTKRFLSHSSIGGGFETFPPDAITDIDFENPSKLRKGSGRRRKKE
jgi:hypothetical protein